jgi:hypothetical protein
MLAPISRYPFFQERHLEAPLFAERDLFLTHLESLGAGHRELSMKASYLLHIVRIMKLKSVHPTTAAEIDCAAQKWASDESPFRIGNTTGIAPGYELSLAYKKIDI